MKNLNSGDMKALLLSPENNFESEEHFAYAYVVFYCEDI